MTCIPKAEYARRRKALMAQMEPNSIAILPAAPVYIRNRDVEHIYRQDSDFQYLTGFPEPEAVLAGANRLAIETDDGDWEVIGFAQAELVAPGTYRLARLLRGREGTDHAIGPASAGARVLLLDGRPVSLPVPAAWLGTERSLRAYAGGGDEEGQGVMLALDLAPSLPLAPVHLLAERLPGSEDVTLAWVRRSRADPDNWALEDAPADLLPEAYRLTILDGATVVRSRICGEPGATYAAAEQLADFGLLPAGLDFEVAQLSPVLGAGHAGRGRFQT